MNEEPKIFIGMERPPLENYTELHANINCSCGLLIETVQGVRWHWESGHFDRPIYITIDEYLERQERIKRKLDNEIKGEHK